MRSSPVPSPLPVPQPGPCWGSPGLLPSRTPILSTLAPFPGPHGPQRAALSRGCPPPTRLPCPAGLPAPPAFAASHRSWPNIHGYPGEDCSPWRRRLGREDLPATGGAEAACLQGPPLLLDVKRAKERTPVSIVPVTCSRHFVPSWPFMEGTRLGVIPNSFQLQPQTAPSSGPLGSLGKV